MTGEKDQKLIAYINREFERTVPIIHKEGENNYLLIQKTKSGMVRILARVSSEEEAREIVNGFIRRMNEGTNP